MRKRTREGGSKPERAGNKSWARPGPPAEREDDSPTLYFLGYLDSLERLVLVRVVDEREALRFLSLRIDGDLHLLDLAVFLEGLSEELLVNVEDQVSHDDPALFY